MKTLTIPVLLIAAALSQAQTAQSTYLFNNTLAPTLNTNGDAAAAVLQPIATSTPTYGSGNFLGWTNKSYLNVNAGQLLQTQTGLLPNDGDPSWVNQFTFIEAVKTTTAGGFGIYDSNNGSGGNGPEAWIDASGIVHTGWDGGPNGNTGLVYSSTQAVNLNQWNWVAVTVDCTTGIQQTKVYVNGTLYVTGVTDVLGGKEPLYGYGAHANSATDFFDFNNVTGGQANLEVAALYDYGQVLTQAQIINATSAPEPVSLTLVGIGAFALLRRRRQ